MNPAQLELGVNLIYVEICPKLAIESLRNVADRSIVIWTHSLNPYTTELHTSKGIKEVGNIVTKWAAKENGPCSDR